MRKGIQLPYLLLINLKTVILKFLENVLTVETPKLTIGFQESLVNTQELEEKER